MFDFNSFAQTITSRFPVLADKVTFPKPKRVYMGPISVEHFPETLEYLVFEAGLDNFLLLAGLDAGENLEFMYVFSDKKAPEILYALTIYAPKENPVIPTIIGLFPNALWHEREVVDLFGAVVEGLPPGLSYPLPDGWPEGNYPMRKDWKVEYFDKLTMTYNPPAPQEEDSAGAGEGQAPPKEKEA